MAQRNTDNQYSSAYAIFEGGGAKALAHVGALRALEQVKLAVVGVAGTSAGAIIAALVAVGYKPDEIFGSAQSHVLQKLGLGSPVDLLGRDKWTLFMGWKRRALTVLAWLVAGIVLLLFKGVLAALMSDVLPASRELAGLVINVLAILCLVIASILLLASLWPVFRDRGIFDSKTIQDIVNRALRAKLLEYKSEGLIDEVPDTVLFEHIDPSRLMRFIPLKIVATNITDGELTLFDRRTPHIPVGDAVAASAALPFAFKPATINGFTRTAGADFADGGLVSNMPSWVFRDEKKARERLETRYGGRDRIPIYAFSLQTTDEEQTLPPAGRIKRAITYCMRVVTTGFSYFVRVVTTGISYFVRVLTTGIFGSQAVVEAFIPDLKVVPLETSLKTMAFDCTGAQAEAAVATGERIALDFLQRERLTEDVTAFVLDSIHAKVLAALVELRGTKDLPRIRVALIDPVCRTSETDIVGFRVIAGANMDGDADDCLEIDLGGSIAPLAFHQNKAVFGEIGTRSPADLLMTKYERALLPSDLHSVIAIPIYARPDEPERPRRVLAIDSDDDLSGEFKSKPFMDSLISASASASRKVIQETVEAALAKAAEGTVNA